MASILCLNAGGIGDLHGLRARRLLSDLDAEVSIFDVDKTESRRSNARAIWELLSRQRWDLVYLESTGVAAGVPLIGARLRWGQRFVVSSGDPVSGYFRTVSGPVVGHAFGLYERLLYRSSAGFIGWTPYLTGRAVHLGAPRGVTIEGAVDLDQFRPLDEIERRQIRTDYGLPHDHLVVGIVGSLRWTSRQQYCYGLELIEMLRYLRRPDVSVLIVGDGSGRRILEDRVSPQMANRVVFTGRVPESEVVRVMNAMDVGFVTQTLDDLGHFRLTTKLPEYLATGLPVAMSPVAGFYDYAAECGWALPEAHPASPEFHEQCAEWLDGLTRDEIADKAAAARPTAKERFDYESRRRRFQRFVQDLLPEESQERHVHAVAPDH